MLVGERSVWGDEAFSIAQAKLSWTALGSLVVESQGNMVLFHALLKPWITALGDGEVAVRSLSVLCAVAAVPVVYLLGLRLFDRTAGLAAALLLAVNALFVAYAQEARSYALALLLVAVSCLLALRLLGGKRRALVVAGYAVVTALAITAHVFAVFMILAHLVGAVLSGASRRALAGQMAGAAGALTLSGPLLVTIAGQDTGQLGWVTQPGLRELAGAAIELAGGTKLLLLAYFGLCVVAVVAALRPRSRVRGAGWRSVALVVAWLVVPVAGAVVVSYVAQPLFVPRYFIVCLPALVLLAGEGIASLPRWGGAAAGAAVLVLAGLALPYLREDYELVNFRDATNFVLERSRPGDGIVFYRPSRRLGFEYYRGRWDRPAPDLRSLYPTAAFGAFDLTDDYRAYRVEPADQARLQSWASRRRVWFFSREEPDPPYREPAQRIVSTLDASSRLVQAREFTGVRLRLYEPSGGGAGTAPTPVR